MATDRLEELAEVMHNAWLEVMAEQGYHLPGAAPPHPLGRAAYCRCTRCREGLVPWKELSEEVKEVNRRGAKAMLTHLGFVNAKGEVEVPAKGAVEKAVDSLTCAKRLLAESRWDAMAREHPERVDQALQLPLFHVEEALCALQGGDE